MAAYIVEYSPLAWQDLLRVRNEVFSACRDKETTDRYMDDLMDAVETMTAFPKTGSPLYYDNLFTSYYRIAFKAYLIFYRLAGNRLLVERVLYGKTDYLRILISNHTKETITMNEKEMILEAMKKAGEPLNAGKIAELTGLDRKLVDKEMAAMKKEGSIVSPVRCKWEPAEK